MDIYRERAHLVALLTSLYPSCGSYNDPENPDWLVVYVETPSGQMSWHIHPDDEDLFPNLQRCATYEWDGHTTETKYERMKELQNSAVTAPLATQAVSAESPKGRAKLDSLLLSYARVTKTSGAPTRVW